MTPDAGAFEPVRVVPKTAIAPQVSIEAAKPWLESYGFTCFFTTGRQKSTNGHADGLAIAKDLTLEIVRIHPPLIWADIRLKNPVFAKIPAVYTPDGYLDLYYRCAASVALEYYACDSVGFALIETVSWAITVPTAGYLIEGSLKLTPTLTAGEHASIKALFKMFDERPTVAEVSRKMLPAAKDITPAPETGFPPLDDENLALIYQTMKVTEDNVALVFEDRYKEELRYCHTWGMWLQWKETRWKAEQTLLAFHFCRLIARKLNIAQSVSASKSGFARGVETFCRASRTFATDSGDWDKSPLYLNTSKGTFDLKTNAMHAHRKEDYITKVTQVAPERGPMPVFTMFLRDITLNDNDLANYLQRALGACLSGAMTDNFLLFCYGTGQNGKNTLGDLITWILGDYAKVVPIDTLTATKGSSHPTVLANLRGLRLAVSSEVSEGSYWDESRVKSLTGDTEISARFMNKDFFEFPRTHKHLVYGNHRPLLRIVDPAMKSRLHIIPFKAYFPPEARDGDMGLKLQAEAPAILQWLIDGHAKWLEDGYLKKCSAVQAETDEYFEAQSTNESWLTDSCVEGDGRSCLAKDLYQNFKIWKESRGEGVISQNRWGEWMSQRFAKRRISSGIVYDGVDIKSQSVFDYQARGQ